MSGAKIQLSAFEKELVQNSEWILTKRSIIDKVYTLFGALAEEYEAVINNTDLPVIIKTGTPKISKGENYHGLPYVVLDYPRLFDKENIFAVRTLFWWGNFFSSTFHLKGKYKKNFLHSLQLNHQLVSSQGFALCIAEDEWDFRFTENNYKAIDALGPDEWNKILETKNFIKLSVKISLENWNSAGNELLKYFQLNLQSAGINFQAGETNL